MEGSREKNVDRSNKVADSNGNNSRNNEFTSSSASFKAKEMEKVINISLSSSVPKTGDKRTNKLQHLNQPCQTTINLYINDPHVLQNSWEKYRKTHPKRKMRNEIVLGKNIPNHILMKNLLGDLGVKKYSSAPNMTNKFNNNRMRILQNDRYTSEGSFTDSTDVISQEEVYRGPEMLGAGKDTKFLYVNQRKSGGDVVGSSIEKINEDEEEKQAVGLNQCLVPCRDDSMVKVKEGIKEKPILRDPLKRFKRRPFKESQIVKNSSILYRDMIACNEMQEGKIQQPRRIQPSFHVRTRMVKEILDSNPQLIHSYQSGLLSNHRRLFDSLRQKNFSDILEEKLDEREDLLPMIKKEREIDEIEVKQTRLILCGRNQRPACSVESHGTYEEYKKKLVKTPDGMLCCRNIDLSDKEDEIWSRAETRSMITSEFVKDKVKKFDKILGKLSGDYQKTNEQKFGSDKNSGTEFQRANIPHEEGPTQYILNEGAVSFPRETKNAMTRLLTQNSKMQVEKARSSDKGLLTVKRMRSKALSQNQELQNLSATCEDNKKPVGNNNGCWPEVAERLRSAAEENMACGVNCRRS